MAGTAGKQGWLAGDPFVSGDLRADQLALGYPVLRGLIMPDLVGPIVLMRRQVYPGDISPWTFAGTAHPAAVTISNGEGVSHGVSSGYEYAAARMFGNGYIGEVTEPIRVDFDAAGDLIEPALPTWPRDLRVTPITGGAFRIVWLYVPWGQGGPPTDFAVYHGASKATISYAAPIGTVVYMPYLIEQFYETGAYGDQTPHAFAVRGRNVDGVAELNEFTTETIKAEAGTPIAATILSAEIRR